MKTDVTPSAAEPSLGCDPANRRPLMQYSRRLLAVIACASQAACASQPQNIEARYVSPTVYQNWSCDQLFDERTRLTKEVDRVSGLQRENANADTAMMTVGIIVLWPVLLGLAATKDRKEELGRLKGEYDAVDLSSRTKQCTAPAPGSPSVPAVATPDTAALLSSMDGTYQGKGKTDAWCQTPSLRITLHGNTAEGELAENATGAKTSTVVGTIDSAGIIGLDFKGRSDEYFSGRTDATVRNKVLNVDFSSRTARACHYKFELSKN